MLDIRRMLQGLRGQPAAGADRPAEASPANPPIRSLGAGVDLYQDRFTVDGLSYPRRAYFAGAALQAIGAGRGRAADWDSQLDRLFLHLSPTMAGWLGRIAATDGALSKRGFVLLVGPTGCGKTTLAKTYCYLANQPCAELSFSGDTTLTDFYTSVEVVRDAGGQSTVTVPGPAVDAMLRGKKLLLNELNMLSPDILSVFTQAMDTGRLLVSGTERGNVEIAVHPQFGILGTANPGYVGTLQLGRAMEPVLKPLGFDWQIGIGVITSFAAREVIVSTLAVVYGVGADAADEHPESLYDTLRAARRSDDLLRAGDAMSADPSRDPPRDRHVEMAAVPVLLHDHLGLPRRVDRVPSPPPLRLCVASAS